MNDKPPKRRMKKRPASTNLVLRYAFDDGDASITDVDAVMQLLQQAAAASVSEEPGLRARGQAQLRSAAVLIAQHQKAKFQLRLGAPAASAANKRRGERTRALIANTGEVGKLSDRHVRRIAPKRK